MRKIFAYLVTVVTLLALMVFFVPSIKESTNFAMEYTGGFEVLYKAKSTMKGVSDNKVASTISAGMNKILDINGIDGAIITVEDGSYIRANVTSNNQIISDEIRNLIQNDTTYEISFRDAENNLLASGDEILEQVAASYTGETNYYGYPVIYLHIKESALDLLRDITTTVSQASDQHLVIWIGFEDGVDSYANIETNATTAKKVIYNATVSEPLDETTITITGDYSEEEAINTVNLINSGTYDYELEVAQVKTVKEEVALKSRNLVLLGIALSVLLPLIAMIVVFKFEGLCSVISILFAEFATIFTFNKIAGVINPQVVSAFVLFNVILFAIMYLLLSKYKNTLNTNKSPIKAYKETFKKNGFIIIDTCVTTLIFAIVTYFLGNNAQQFAICLAVSSVSVFISLFLLERFGLYLVCDYFNKNNKSVIVSSLTSKEDKQVNDTFDLDNYAKPAFFGFSGLVSLGIIVVLITSLALKTPFNMYSDGNNTSTLEIVTSTEHFKTEAEVSEFFAQESIDLELTSIELSKSSEGYHIVVTSDENITNIESTLKEKLQDKCGENTDYIENYVVYLNDYDSTSLLISFKSTLYTSGIALLVVALYFALRYKYSYAIATLSVVLMSVASLLAFFGITRIPVNNATIIGISITCAYALLLLVPYFTKIKEYMNDTKKIYLSYQDRIDCFTKGRASIAPTLVTATIVLDILSLFVMFFDLNNFSMYLSFVIGSWFVIIYTLIFVPKVWLLFENKSDKRKKTFKNKNIANSKYRRLDEQVFIGLND